MKTLQNIVLLSCLLPIANCLSAQYDPSKINKKALSLYSEGLDKAQSGNFKEAIDLLTQSINADAKYLDAYLSLAGVYGQLKNYKSSADNYEKAIALDSNYTNE